MESERGQLPDIEKLQIPEADPSCAKCRRLAEVARLALGMLGEVRQEVRQAEKETRALEARVEEVWQQQAKLATAVKATSARPPGGAIPKPTPGQRRRTAARRKNKKSRRKPH